MAQRKKKVLIIAAHPDDEILGAFSYLHNQSYTAKSIFVCEGSSARFEFRAKSKKLTEAIKKREAAAQDVAKELKNLAPVFLNFPNLELSTRPILEINQKINPIIESFLPDLIITHTQFCNNNDHKIVSYSVSNLVRSNSHPYVSTILHMEIPSSSEQSAEIGYRPTHFMVLNESQINLKIKLLGFYAGELQPDPKPRSDFGIRAYASFRGLAAGTYFAESFSVIKNVIRVENTLENF